MEQVPFLSRHALDRILDQVFWVFHTKEACKVAPFAHLFVDRIGDFLALIPFCHVWFDLGFDPFSDLRTESSVCLVVVRRVVLPLLA